MKNIFGFNKSLYGETGTEQFDGARFISATVSEENSEASKAEEKKLPTLPIAVTVLQYFFVGIFAVALAIWISSGTSLIDLWKTKIYIPIMIIAGFIGFVVISVIDGLKSKKFATENGLDTLAELEEYAEIHEVDEEAEAQAAAKVKAELGIPEDAVDMDFFSNFYREGPDGVFSIKPFNFMTLEMFAFADGENLCVADFNNVYSIPKSNITSVEKIEEEITVLGWSKEESFDSETYAEYGFTENEAGFIVMPYYYSVKVNTDDGEEFAFLIPPYELGAFTELSGIGLN